MKKTLVLVVLFMLVVVFPVFAEVVEIEHQDHGSSVPLEATVHDHLDSHTVAGVKIDMPYLIGLKQISSDLFLGIEAGKDLLNDPFHPDTRSYFEDDKGGFVYAKVTFVGCLLNCPKK